MYSPRSLIKKNKNWESILFNKEINNLYKNSEGPINKSWIKLNSLLWKPAIIMETLNNSDIPNDSIIIYHDIDSLKYPIYLDNFDSEFIGLTGEIDQIYRFSTQVNAPFFPVVNNTEPNYTVDHSGSLVLINPDGQYAGFFRAPHDTDKIIKALASAIN